MIKKLYKKENNLLQSLNWIAFLEGLGHKYVNLGESSGVVYDLPFGKKFISSPKGPDVLNIKEIINNAKPEKPVFVRIEPEKISDDEIKKYGLKKVGAGTLLSGQASPKATRVLDISKSEEEILAAMKPKTRYNIRLAEKKGVTIKMLDSDDILYELLEKTSKRDRGYHPHEKKYYTKMIKELAKNDVAHIFVAEHEGDFLAAILVGFFGEVATYLHGGFDDKKRNLMAPYLCQWEAIKYAKKHGCTLYDFWGVAETDDPKDPWAGITRFKEGFGGEKVIFAGTYDIVLNKFWYNVLTIAAKIKHLVKK